MSDKDRTETAMEMKAAAKDIAVGAATKGWAGAVKAGGKSLIKSRAARRAARKTGAVICGIVIVLMLLLPSMLGFTGDPTTSGVAHVNDVALNGSNISGFDGAAQASGLGDEAVTIAEKADSQGVPAEIILALVSKTSGPWRAKDDDIVGNAQKVTDSLAAARDATASQGGWDMLSGTITCDSDVLVIAGQNCPDGTETVDDGGAVRAKQVREAWVAALMTMGEGLGAPTTAQGAPGASDQALAAPEELSGDPGEMISQLATATYGLDASAVTTDGQLTTVATADPLPLATTITTRNEQIGVSRLEAKGQSWDPQQGWAPIEPEVDATTQDPTASGQVRVWTCDPNSGCPTQTSQDERLTREQADAVYTTALAWRLGTASQACTTTAATTVTGDSSVTEIASASGEKIEITPIRAGYVAAIIEQGKRQGANDTAIIIALMTVLQESRLNMYANSNNPESLSLPHDTVGSDHDSVGLFQQRDSWGSTADRMDATRSAQLFFERLIPWMAAHPTVTPGQAAQGIQISAFPDAYDQWEQAARQLAGGTTTGTGTAGCTGTTTGAQGTGWLYPIASVGAITSPWDPARYHPVLGRTRPHWGTDIAALPIGTDLVAVASGTVSYANCDGSGLCQIDYDTDDGWRIRYLHIVAGSWTVNKGDKVEAGQAIAKLGNTGVGTGAHLHVETSPLDKIGDSQWCEFDAAWADRCPNPVDTFSAHGVDLATGTVTQPDQQGGAGSSGPLDFARTKIGGPYVWGGEGPSGYDCSGLVQAAFATQGVTLQHSAASQCQAGTAVSAQDARAGDIVCWGSPAYHVAIYNGQDGIVGAQTYSTGIVETPLYGDYYFRRLTS